MKIVKASYLILSKIESSEMLKSIERAGRTCYKSEGHMNEETSRAFVKMLIERGHESVLEHEKISVLFVCDRGVSHELVRHRIASFSQESTRYCNYAKGKFDNELTFIDIKEHMTEEQYRDWLNAIGVAEDMYLSQIELGSAPQIARSVLPNSLKTEIVVTANLREWRTIFKQRTAKAAHPQMRELMRPLLDELKNEIPVVFDDISY